MLITNIYRKLNICVKYQVIDTEGLSPYPQAERSPGSQVDRTLEDLYVDL